MTADLVPVALTPLLFLRPESTDYPEDGQAKCAHDDAWNQRPQCVLQNHFAPTLLTIRTIGDSDISIPDLLLLLFGHPDTQFLNAIGSFVSSDQKELVPRRGQIVKHQLIAKSTRQLIEERRTMDSQILLSRCSYLVEL